MNATTLAEPARTPAQHGWSVRLLLDNVSVNENGIGADLKAVLRAAAANGHMAAAATVRGFDRQ